MFGKITFILCLMLSLSAMANSHNKIDTLGYSKAGQFVALEEYGYKKHTHSYFVTIKIINVWTKEYVGKTVEVEEPALSPIKLKIAREKAKRLADDDLKRFKIPG
jgi:predicted secreted protein